MPPTVNAAQPDRTQVCAEATTPDDHKGCSGGFCRCACHLPELDPPLARPVGRWVAPPSVLEQLAAVREARRRREGGGGR